MSLTLADGYRSGKLQIVRQAEKHECSPNQSRYKCYVCKCDCGNEIVVRSTSLRNDVKSRQTLSCGCLQKESASGRDPFWFEKRKYTEYKASAKVRNLNFDLSFEDFIELINGDCIYCDGVGPNGIDRMDNDTGYEYDNCVSCCPICNRAKRDMGQADFFRWLFKIAEKWRIPLV